MIEIKKEYSQDAFNLTNGCVSCATRDMAADIKELSIGYGGRNSVLTLCRKCRMELMNVLAKDVGTEIPMSSFGVPYGTEMEGGIVTNVANIADNTYFRILPEGARCYVTTQNGSKVLYVDVPDYHTIHPQVHFKDALTLKESKDYIIKDVCSRVAHYDEYMSGKYARIDFPVRCISEPDRGHFKMNKKYDATFFLCAGEVDMSITDDRGNVYDFDIKDEAWHVTLPNIMKLPCDMDSMTRLKDKLLEFKPVAK